MENKNNKLKFTLMWSSCLGVLLLMVVLGVSSSVKGTAAAESAIDPTYTCSEVDAGEYTPTLSSDNKCVVNFEKVTTKDYNSYEACWDFVGTVWSGSCDEEIVDEGFKYSCSCSVSARKTCPEGYILNIWGTQCVLYGSSSSSSSSSGSSSEGEVCPDGQVMTDDGCVDEDDDTGVCWECNGTGGIRYWSELQSEAQTAHPECGGGWHQLTVDESQCVSTTNSTTCPDGQIMTEDGCVDETDSGSERCYQCVGYSNKTFWGSSMPSESYDNCNSPWTVTDLPKNQCHGSSDDSGVLVPKAIFMASVSSVFKEIVATPCDKFDGYNYCITMPTPPSSSITSWNYAGTCKGQSYQIGVEYGINSNTTYWPCGSTGGNSGGTTSDPEPSTSNPSSSSEPSTSIPSSNPEENITENPQTGQIAIFVVWVIAAAAIVYSIWYFKQVREN